MFALSRVVGECIHIQDRLLHRLPHHEWVGGSTPIHLELPAITAPLFPLLRPQFKGVS